MGLRENLKSLNGLFPSESWKKALIKINHFIVHAQSTVQLSPSSPLSALQMWLAMIKTRLFLHDIALTSFNW